MSDLTFIDKAAFWVNLTYIASVVLTLVSGFLIVYFSHQRSVTLAAETRKLELEFAQQTAVANERAAAANHAAELAQSEAASAVAATEKTRKENLELALALEREKRMRLEMEDRLARQPQPQAMAPTNGPRILTHEQEQTLISAMSRFPGVRASLIELGDVEAGALARDLSRLLQEAKWNIFVSRFGALVPPQHGIVCTHDTKNAAATELVRTLRSFNLTVYERSGTEDQFEILIGLKPPR